MSPPWRTRTELLHQTTTLHAQGLTRRAIARALSVSRNTVRKMLVDYETARREAHTALPGPPVRAPRTQKLDAFRGKMAELLERYPHITAQRVFEELRSAGFDGGYTAVKRYVRAVRPRPAKRSADETRNGVKCFCFNDSLQLCSQIGISQ